MVARTCRLRHAGHAFREQSRKQHRRFHLCAGHRHLVVDRMQPRGFNFQRCKIVIARANVRAHLSQRPYDPLHRPLLQRSVSGKFCVELLSRQNARQQPHRRPGISSVQRAPAAFQTSWPLARNPDRILLDFYLRAQRAHAAQRAMAIRRCGKMPQFAGALRQSGHHRVAMRNRFVSRRLHAARQMFCSFHPLFFHAKILARRARSFPHSPVSPRGLTPHSPHFPFTSFTSSPCPSGQFCERTMRRSREISIPLFS